jgi:hypothetical protein
MAPSEGCQVCVVMHEVCSINPSLWLADGVSERSEGAVAVLGGFLVSVCG